MFRPLAVLVAVVSTAPIYATSRPEAPLTIDDIPAGVPADVRTLIEELLGSDLESRMETAKKLGAMHEKAAAAAPYLIQLSETHDPNGIVTEALVQIGSPALEASIVRLVEVASPPSWSIDYRACNTAIARVGRFKSPRAVDIFLDMLQWSDPVLQRKVLEALKGCDDPRVALRLLDAMKRYDATNRYHAIECYKTLPDPRRSDLLLRLLKESNSASDWELAASIAHVFGNWRDRRAVPELLKIVKDPTCNQLLRHYSARALGEIGDPAGMQWLAETLADRKASILRSTAANALGRYRASPGAAVDGWNISRVRILLESVLTEENVDPEILPKIAVEALGELGDPNSIGVLCKIAESHSHDDYGYAAALSAVKISDGKLDDVWVVRAIRNQPDFNPESSSYVVKEDALDKLKANAGSRAQAELRGPTERERQEFREEFQRILPNLLYIIGIVTGVLFLLWRKSARSLRPV